MQKRDIAGQMFILDIKPAQVRLRWFGQRGDSEYIVEAQGFADLACFLELYMELHNVGRPKSRFMYVVNMTIYWRQRTG